MAQFAFKSIFQKSPLNLSVFDLESGLLFNTLPTAEILSGKNARAYLFCGFLMKAFKKNILKI